VEARHYLEILADLSVPAGATSRPVRRAVYHDSCYLGRLNGLYDAPREFLRRTGQGIELVSLKNEREDSLCCGGGGGRILLEEERDKRASLLKMEEVVSLGADLFLTSCPYCLSLFRDAAAVLGGKVEVKDLLEAAGTQSGGGIPVTPKGDMTRAAHSDTMG
jgi:Fe-S oxidoreductase